MFSGGLQKLVQRRFIGEKRGDGIVYKNKRRASFNLGALFSSKKNGRKRRKRLFTSRNGFAVVETGFVFSEGSF